jgi:polar amino acid transport system substrate-binding protein
MTDNIATVRAELAPTGTLRVALNMSNFLLTATDPATGAPCGLAADQDHLPGSRILEGNFTAVQQAAGTPKGRPAGAAYLRAFIEDIKATGLVARTIAKHNVRGLTVAPPA